MSFSTGNLEACAAQMASWQPFACGPAAMVEGNGNVAKGATSGERYVHPEVVGHQNTARCNSAVTMFGENVGAGVGGVDASRLGAQLVGRSISCPVLNVKSGETARGNNIPLLPCRDDVVAVSSGHHFGAAICTPSRGMALGGTTSASLAKCYSLPTVQEARWDIFSATTSMCNFSSSRQGLMHEGRKRVGRWSKRKKQMSHAFLKSLWRWKEGVHARKRRKRAVVGSCSGSGARSYTSDPPTVGAASTGNPRSVTGTDSSGELFFGVVGNHISWGADLIPSRASSESGFCNGHHEVRDVGADHPLTCWFSTHSDGALSTESGYNSEPGYSADSELNCTDDGFVDDDDDEDEKQPMHLVVWKDMAPGKTFHAEDKGHIMEECVVELFYGKNHRIRRLQPRLRQTRRPWRQSDLFKSR